MLSRKPFYYVRHGETEWNRLEKLQGNTDTPLNETGIAQAHQARRILSELSIATICCSPLQRARKTADIINQSLNCELVELNGLRECSFGSHEGSLTHDWLNDWLVGEDENLPQDVEPISDFLARTTNAINLALEHPGPVLIVAHGGTYMAINQSLARDQQWNLPNCQPVRHEPPIESGGHWRLKLL